MLHPLSASREELLNETPHELLANLSNGLDSGCSEPRQLARWRLRWALSGALLIVGVVLLPFPWHGVSWFRPGILSNSYSLPIPSLFLFVALLVSTVAAATSISWTTFRDEVQRTVQESAADSFSWTVWLAAYAIIIAALLYFRPGGGEHETPDASSIAAAGLTLAALVVWLPAVMPLRFWLRWAQRSAKAFVIGGMIAILTYVVSFHYTPRLTGFVDLIHRPTLWTVYFVLRLLGEQVSFDSATYLIGTPAFSVYVNSACSGREGIGLFLTFFGLYLWVCRRELRFPQVFLLLPLGVGTLWLLNAVRIALLIILGSWSSSLAIEGFHSVAGWLFFIAISLATVIASQRSRTFAKIPAAHELAPNPAAPYLMPLIVIVVTAMIARVFFYRFDVLYPLRVIAGASALWFYRKMPVLHQWQFSWPAVGVGILAFIVWLGLARPDHVAAADAALRTTLGNLPVSGAGLWLLFRVIGAMLLVPLAEELAFRGYLIRKLISADFEEVSSQQFTWLSFLGSSMVFGALHAQWIAGTIAGMLFAAALYRRGSLADAVTAHATTNGLLSLYVLTSGHWAWWG